MIAFDVVPESGPTEGELTPVDPSRHRIALIGCGAISALHLAAYRDAGFVVSLLCDRSLAKARSRRDELFPGAGITTSVQDVLGDPDIDIVDVATHVHGRPPLVRQLLLAGKNVLSQKPFVQDLDEGEMLIELAGREGKLLAVNHNGRWAPHFAVALACVARGDIGTVTSADFDVYWSHDLVVQDEPKFAGMFDVLVYDFGIHWFDVVAQLFPKTEPATVWASAGMRPGQCISAPTQLDVVVEYPAARASIRFRASSRRAESGSFRIEGTDGVIRHSGASLGGGDVRIDTETGSAVVRPSGDWWTNGMTGTMAELMAAVEHHRLPRHAATTSLPGLALCFAAMQSIRSGHVVAAGSARTVPADDR